MTTYRIVSDSSSNVYHIDSDIEYTTTPLKIMIEGHEYADEDGLDLEALVTHIEGSSSNSTSCPNAHEWLNAFEGADTIFAITISSSLSGRGIITVNDEVTLTASLENFLEDDIYVCEWQYTPDDGLNFYPIEESNALTYTFNINEFIYFYHI